MLKHTGTVGFSFGNGGYVMNLGIGQIALLIVLALVLFGPKRLPELGRAVGNAIREFKSALNGVMSTEKKSEESEISSSEMTKTEDKGDKNA